jgi:hypothetical protein
MNVQSDLRIRIRSGTRFRKNSGRYSYIKVVVLKKPINRCLRSYIALILYNLSLKTIMYLEILTIPFL